MRNFLNIFSKINKNGSKINIFKSWFFRWVGNLMNYVHLKIYETGWKNGLIVKKMKFEYIFCQKMILLFFKKIIAVSAKINFFEFWFFCWVKYQEHILHLWKIQRQCWKKIIFCYFKMNHCEKVMVNLHLDTVRKN